MAESELEQGAGGAEGVTELDDFSALLKQNFKPRNETAETEVENAVATLVSAAMEDASVISEEVDDTISAMIAAIDAKLTLQVNEIIHCPEYQELESSWRGLAYLINNSETDATLKINVFNASKKELEKELRAYQGAKWDQSPLFDKIYETEFGTLGGQPYGCLIGDYQFDHSPMDVRLLRDIGKIAEASMAPFMTAAAPTLLGLDSWNELGNPRDLSTVFDTPEYAQWSSLRDDPISRFIGISMPRVLSREVYGSAGQPVEGFNFEEDTDGHTGEKYAWMSSAYAMATNINRAQKEHGWTVKIRGVQSGGEVANLPTHVFDTGEGDVDMKCPTEYSISDRREGELSKSGLLGLIHRKNTDKAAFIGGQSLYRPKTYKDEQATASDNLASRIPYMFAVSRFSHYLKVMVRDQVGMSRTRGQIEQELQSWIGKYVDGSPETSSEEVKAKRPLADAKVEIIEDEENPGYYLGKFFLKPHFQMEGMDVGMSLVSKLPSK